MSPTTLSQTPGRPTVNPPDPTPEARPEVGLHRPCSRAIQVSPAVSAPGPGRARQVPRPGSAHLRRDPPRAPRPAPALRPAPRLPAASRFSVLTSTGVPPASGDLAGSGLFPTRAARTRGTHPGGAGTPRRGRRPGPRALGGPPKGRRPGPPRTPSGRAGPAPTRGPPPNPAARHTPLPARGRRRRFRQTRRPGNSVPPPGAAPPIGRGTPPSPL